MGEENSISAVLTLYFIDGQVQTRKLESGAQKIPPMKSDAENKNL